MIQELYDFFHITRKDFWDSKLKKVVEGVGGSAKSSNLHKIFIAEKSPYGRYTSTNKLKKDALRRYGGQCDTIAGGLFHTENGEFFRAEKDECPRNIVIDEFMQTDKKIFEWVNNHAGDHNIIMCTDICQMLSPYNGESMKEAYERFIEQDDVIVIHLDKTYRARDTETEEYYYDCYRAVRTGLQKYPAFKKTHPPISFEQVEYNYNDVYITHTNEIEKMLFDSWGIGSDYSAPLIPKGTIARKEPKDPEKYPIIPQIEASGYQGGYWQPEHIGTPTRYQGSEVTETQKLYFFVEKNSRVEPREWYTVISRCYHISSLQIVYVDIEKQKPLTEFNGYPIVTPTAFHIPEDFAFQDGKKIDDFKDSGSGKYLLPEERMDDIRRRIEVEDTPYNKNVFIYKGEIGHQQREQSASRARTVYGMLKKEPELRADYMDDFLRTLERRQRELTGDTANPVKCDFVSGPMLNNFIGNGKIRDRKTYQYGIDLKGAYPHILNSAPLPTGKFTPAPIGYETWTPHPQKVTDGLDWFMYHTTGEMIVDEWSIMTWECACALSESGCDGIFVYLGSTECQIGSKMGKWLHEMCHKSVEAANEIKELHYGFMQKPYMERIMKKNGKGEILGYMLNGAYRYELLMCAIRSRQTLIMTALKGMVYGEDWQQGFTNVDCLYFDTDYDIEELGKAAAKMLPDYDFRIFDNQAEGAPILFQTYETLKTRAEIKREQARARYKKRQNAHA